MKKLEELTLYDKKEVLELYRSFIGTDGCTWDESYPNEKTFKMDVTSNNLFGIRENNKIIAVISIDKDDVVANISCWSPALKKTAEISRLAVSSEYQDQGLAGQMIMELCSILKIRGYDGVHYLVYPHNLKALAAYRKVDFKLAGECDLYDHHWLCYEQKL